MNHTLAKTFPVGRFLVSPSARITESGDFTASLSIRSGRGSASHDRVFRFVPRFATREGALRYATSQSDGLLPQFRA
ncbi:MAG: hypothetical protein RJA36_1026 [Pseudomonadota bacterium]|jgi:hypothetical protein